MNQLLCIGGNGIFRERERERKCEKRMRARKIRDEAPPPVSILIHHQLLDDGQFSK